MQQGGSIFQNFNSKPTENRHLGRTRRRWEDNIRKDLKEIGIYTRNRVDLTL